MVRERIRGGEGRESTNRRFAQGLPTERALRPGRRAQRHGRALAELRRATRREPRDDPRPAAPRW